MKDKKNIWIVGLIIAGILILKYYWNKLPLQSMIHITEEEGIFATLPGWAQIAIIAGVIYTIYAIWSGGKK